MAENSKHVDVDPENAVDRRAKEARQNRIISLTMFVASPVVYPLVKQIEPRGLGDARLVLDALTTLVVPLMAYALLVASDFSWAPKSWRPARTVHEDGVVYRYPGTNGVLFAAVMVCSTAFTVTIADSFRSPAAYIAFAVNTLVLLHAILYATISQRIVTITPEGFTDVTSAWFGDAVLRCRDIRSVRISADGKTLVLDADVVKIKRRFGVTSNSAPSHTPDERVPNLILDPRDVGFEARDIARIALARNADGHST